MNIYSFDLAQRIIHLLVLRSKFAPELGLLNGQMGVVLAFSSVFRSTQLEIYEYFMNDLLENLIGRLNNEMALTFNEGLLGIGWGLEYLIQNEYVGGDATEICADIDAMIMERNPRRNINLSLETGFEGLLHYILVHLQGALNQHRTLPFDEDYLADVYDAVKQVKQKKHSLSLNTLLEQYIQFYTNRIKLDYKVSPSKFINLQTKVIDPLKSPLGLHNGLAGFLFQQYGML